MSRGGRVERRGVGGRGNFDLDLPSTLETGRPWQLLHRRGLRAGFKLPPSRGRVSEVAGLSAGTPLSHAFQLLPTRFPGAPSRALR